MRPEDVPQQWRTLMIGAIHDALDDNMLAAHYADIERMVDAGLAAVAPLIAARERKQICDALRQIASYERNADAAKALDGAALAIQLVGEEQDRARETQP